MTTPNFVLFHHRHTRVHLPLTVNWLHFKVCKYDVPNKRKMGRTMQVVADLFSSAHLDELHKRAIVDRPKSTEILRGRAT